MLPFAAAVLAILITHPSQLYFAGGDLGPPFEFNCVYRVDLSDLSVSSIWRSDLYLGTIQCAANTHLLALHGGTGGGLGIIEKNDIYVLSENGIVLHHLTDVTNRLAWSPDGKRLAYCPMDRERNTPNGEIWILDAASGRKEKITETGYELYWSHYRDVILIWSDAVYSWDVVMRKRSLTHLPISTREFSSTEEFCMNDCGSSFEVCRLRDLMTEDTLTTIQGEQINGIPIWLNGHLLRTYSHRDKAYGRRWFVYDARKFHLFESKERIIAADDEDSLLAVKDGKIDRKRLDELTQVPLDRLKIELAPGVRSDANSPNDAGDKK